MKDNTPIGTVVLYYNEDSTVQTSVFTPDAITSSDDELADRMQSINAASDEKAIREQAEFMVSAWFARLNRIELADRDRYEIITDTVSCERWKRTGTTRKCTLHFTLKKKEVQNEAGKA